ncbi:MAG: Ig-like domain-containing protein [Planctomycetota bacterium]
MNPFRNLRTSFLLVLAAAASCTGGARDNVGPFSGSFEILGTEPLNGGRLFLNDPIRFDFTTPIDLDSATLDTVSFSVLDLNGTPVAEQPTGRFQIATRPGDTEPGRRLLFVPTLPTNDAFDNGGFRPGRTYLVRLVGGDRRNSTVLKDTNGQGLGNAQTFRFTTADGATPTQLFRNIQAGGPRGTGLTITPTPGPDGVPLNKFGSPTVEIRLNFDQALNPNSANVPVALDTNPLFRSGVSRGRVFLEYFDPEFNAPPNTGFTWIPAKVELERNSIDGSTVVLRPVGVLPNNALVRVIVESTMEDISGESNVANAAFQRVFAAQRDLSGNLFSFRTVASYEPQFDALVEQFRSTDQVDFDAAFLEPQAQVGNGFVRAGFEFEGTSTELDFIPSTASVTLDTDFTQVVPANGLAFNVSGGQFNFRNVLIPSNVIVNGQGTRPMVWLVRNEFRVDGLLSVRGGDGARVNTLNSANFPTANGVGVCGGGNGGRGSPGTSSRSPLGEPGDGPFQLAAGGGGPGVMACDGCNIGSGGGGGSLATQGDPWYRFDRGAGSSFQQVEGLGGNGCAGASGAPSRTLQGGAPGPRAFNDARSDNDFWGVGINNTVGRRIRIRGELAAPLGGGGGGGGGDRSSGNCNLVTDNTFINDNKGGGGGGGGGVLIVKALGKIIIGPQGRIEADGGHGGGGEQAGSCNQGGGGGGGSGGMVILMSATGIDINVRGIANPTFNGTNGQPRMLARYTDATIGTPAVREQDYTFSISADGGICRTGQFLTPDIEGKYSVTGQNRNGALRYDGDDYDIRPLGGFGGMGVVQLMAPPVGPNGPNDDNTNTVLDDNINMIEAGFPQTGVRKQQLLAWRGFPNAQGTPVDDQGQATFIGKNEGDIRPAPLLLPVPFNAVTRVRSKWIDLGAATRRSVNAPDGQPRGIIDPTGDLRGPIYAFEGVKNDPANPLSNGYADFSVSGGRASVNYTEQLLGPLPQILSTATGQTFRGQAAHSITLASPVLGANDRFSQYEAELRDANNRAVGSFRILSHTDRNLLVAASDGPLPALATQVQVLAKFFRVLTDGTEGLGSTYTGIGTSGALPLSNVRIGFAFHTNPDPSVPGTERYPSTPDTYAYDLTDPATIEFIRSRGMRFVQWDVQFNSVYRENSADPHPRPFGPTSPRPELRFLRLPFRF